MILRRLAAAFRRQDWFAAGLEIMIVVLGVFIGIQMANWNEALQERIEQRSVEQRLQSDFRLMDQALIEGMSYQRDHRLRYSGHVAGHDIPRAT